MTCLPYLVALPTELLVQIFQHLNFFDLDNLRECCVRFRNVIDENTCWYDVPSIDLIVTSDVNRAAYERFLAVLPHSELECSSLDSYTSYRSYLPELNLFEKHKYSLNWRIGYARQTSFLRRRLRYMPWLQLEKEHVWISRGEVIKRFDRTDDVIDTKNPSLVLDPFVKDDVCRYVVKNGYVFAGQTSGNLLVFDMDKDRFVARYRCHYSDIEDVDMCGETIATGSRDKIVRVWANMLENPLLYGCVSIEMPERVWCVGLWDQDFVAVGTVGNTQTSGSVVDLYTRTSVLLFQNTLDSARGIKQLKWQSKNLVWTCGYDGVVKRWDLRTGTVACGYDDPLDSAIYCFDTDFETTLLTGSQTDGRVALWDVRMSRCVQLYYMDTCKGCWSSPVYSLAYDPCYLFVATQRHLNVLDFTKTPQSDTRDWTSFLRIKCY